jgi:aryl-alcohol dehydrogenase-like predicted oxidoreductase
VTFFDAAEAYGPHEVERMPWSPLGVGFLAGAIEPKTRFAEGDIRGIERGRAQRRYRSRSPGSSRRSRGSYLFRGGRRARPSNFQSRSSKQR